MAERNLRRYPRQVSRIPARVVFDWGALEGTIDNIGEGGALFATDTLEGIVQEEARATVCFEGDVPGAERRLPGTVLRLERSFVGGEILRTLAIRFDEPYRPATPHPRP
jgi:hypothetical protein